MAGSYSGTLIQVIFGMIPPIDFEGWYVGLWENFAPTFYPLADGEIPNTRLALNSANFSLIDTSTIQYDQWLVFTDLPAGYVDGWFVVNGLTEDNCSWYMPFTDPIRVNQGDSLELTGGSIKLAYNDGTATFDGTGGGGGDPPAG